MENILSIAKKLYDEWNIRKTTYLKISDYYDGKTDVAKNYKKIEGRSNRKVSTNFVKQFIEEEVSFLVGSDITYSSRKGTEGVVDDIEFILSNQNGSLDIDLATTLNTYGTVYELYYINKGQFKVKTISPLQGQAYCNQEGEVELFIYMFNKDLDNTTYIDIIDGSCIYHLDEHWNKVAEPTMHFFNCCPVGIAKFKNGINDTIYNNIKNLQDSYEGVLADCVNECGDTRQAYLAIYGAKLEPEDAKQIKDMGVMQFEGKETKAEYIIKNLSSDFMNTCLQRLEQVMYKVTQHIDHQEKVQSNTSGVMLESRLLPLRNKLTATEKVLQNCIRSRIRCLFRYLELEENKKYDYKDIKIKFTLNLPRNDMEIAQMIPLLKDYVSGETLINKLSFVTNGKKELERVKEERLELFEADAKMFE